MILSFLRVLKFSLQDFWRNFWLSFATISILVLALFSVNILISMKAMTDNVIAVVEDKVDINIFVSNDATDAELNNFEIFLRNIKEVDEVVFMGKSQVLEDFQQKNLGNPDIQEAIKELEENPFNDTLVIKAENTDDYDKIFNDIKSSEYDRLIDNDDFSDPQKIISFVQDVDDKLERFGFFVAGIFMIISFLIVFNTIRVTIYTHKDEIAVMRLVGATPWFVRGPYIISSILYAVVAMIFKVLIFYGVLNFTSSYIHIFFGNYGIDLLTYFNSHFVLIFGLELIAMILLTVLSSGFAIRRYLRA